MAAAALLLALAWCATFFWRYLFHGSSITWGYAVIDLALAAFFWREARAAIFALPLFYCHVTFVIVYFSTTIFKLTDWWALALANRLFELEIFYIIACAIYRIRSRAKKKKRAPRPSRRSPDFTCLIEQFRPPSRLAAFPMAAMIGVGRNQRRNRRRLGENHLLERDIDLAP